MTTLELFFDLVFVFTLTQLTHLLEDDLTVSGAAQVFLVFGVLWWMYGGYAWLTNQVAPRLPVQRLLLLVGMAGFLITAVSIPHVFDGTGVLFGLGYLVVCVHLALLSQSDAPRGVIRLAPFNLLAAGLILTAGFLDGPAVYALWVTALAIQVVSPYLGVAPQFTLNAEHFVERHGLLMIVALGESVIAIGIGVDADQLSTGVVAVVVLALILPAALWWTYFSGDDTAAEHTLTAAEPERRAILAIRAYFYAHIPNAAGHRRDGGRHPRGARASGGFDEPGRCDGTQRWGRAVLRRRRGVPARPTYLVLPALAWVWRFQRSPRRRSG